MEYDFVVTESGCNSCFRYLKFNNDFIIRGGPDYPKF